MYKHNNEFVSGDIVVVVDHGHGWCNSTYARIHRNDDGVLCTRTIVSRIKVQGFLCVEGMAYFEYDRPYEVINEQ